MPSRLKSRAGLSVHLDGENELSLPSPPPLESGEELLHPFPCLLDSEADYSIELFFPFPLSSPTDLPRPFLPLLGFEIDDLADRSLPLLYQVDSLPSHSPLNSEADPFVPRSPRLGSLVGLCSVASIAVT